uniref:ORF5a n=1 Tax=Porcine reproductive and respiratory syndrome virus TaxID=28344 RepID=A0A220T1Z4_PRRSV|nr:ORF5a [Porcine reproductive and respiratory syndrome virus]
MFKHVGEMLDRGLLLALSFFVVYRAVLFYCARQRQRKQQLLLPVDLQLDAM